LECVEKQMELTEHYHPIHYSVVPRKEHPQVQHPIIQLAESHIEVERLVSCLMQCFDTRLVRQ